MNKSDLTILAESKGVDVKSDWTKADIQSAIDALTGSVYTCNKTNFSICGVKFADEFVLTDSQKNNTKFMKRFNRAIELGVIND